MWFQSLKGKIQTLDNGFVKIYVGDRFQSLKGKIQTVKGWKDFFREANIVSIPQR